MRLHFFCLASVLIGISSALPMHVSPVEKRVAALYFLTTSELASLRNSLGEYHLRAEDRGEVLPAGEEVQTLNENKEQQPQEGGEYWPGQSIRSRRSTQPRGNNDQGNGDRGNVDVDVSRTRDGGTRVEASGRGTVWESRDGRGRAEVHGHYERERGGRGGNGRSNYGGGVRYSHRF